MQKTILILASILFSFTSFSQIEIPDYERKLTWDVDQLEKLVPVPATSTCGIVKMETKDTMFSGGCLGTLVRTYLYSDDCGNTAEAEQYILLKDDKAPVLHNIPADVTTSANDLPIVAKVTASDNIGDDEIKVIFNEVKSEGKIIRTWTAVDNCGNATEKKQVITLEEL